MINLLKLVNTLNGKPEVSIDGVTFKGTIVGQGEMKPDTITFSAAKIKKIIEDEVRRWGVEEKINVSFGCKGTGYDGPEEFDHAVVSVG